MTRPALFSKNPYLPALFPTLIGDHDFIGKGKPMVQAELHTVFTHLCQWAGAAHTDTLTDSQLLQHFLARRDEAAFAALVRRHGGLVWGVCRQVLGHDQDAEDAFQAAFLALARHAAALRHTEAVSSWLYRVAYRVATKAGRDMAERRAREQEAAKRAPGPRHCEVAWRELQAVLQEELDRLPEKYRAPFVLCCLEGKSKAEAARHLGWKEGTVSGRLAQARKQMQQRLARRGISLSAVLCATTLALPAAAAPARLVRSTVTTAVLGAENPAGVVPAKVAALVDGVNPSVFGTKAKIATLLLLAVGLGAAGLGLMPQRDAAAQTESRPKAEPVQPPPKRQQPAVKQAVPKAPAEAVQENKDGTVTVRGRVLGPNGKPFAGAKVYLSYLSETLPKLPVRATSGKDGRFQFTFSKSDYIDEEWINQAREPWRQYHIVVTAPGHGPDGIWMPVLKGELTLRLVKDDVLVKGRVVDLQGRPVAGARVGVRYIYASHSGLWRSSCVGGPMVTARKDGRFTLSGIGRERKVRLRIEGPTIEQQDVFATTKPASKERPGESTPIEVIAMPTKPVEGVLRALDTGKPLAGVVVYGVTVSNDELHYDYKGEVRAVSDRQGRYRLLGLPKARKYRIEVHPAKDQPYLMTERVVGDTEGLKAISLNIDLRRGVRVRFRLIDKGTGRPVRGLVQYRLLEDNKHFREAPHWLYGPRPRAEDDKDRFFNLVVFPGPGVIVAKAGHDSGILYLRARFTPADLKARPALNQALLVFGGGSDAVYSHAYRLLDTTDTKKTLCFDLEVDPGRTLRGVLRGPDGKPVRGATAYGLSYNQVRASWHGYSPSSENVPLEADAFTVAAVDPRGPSRTLTFVHRGRKLIGHLILKGDEKGPLVVTLQRWGGIAGRLLDAQGNPLSKVSVSLHYPSSPPPGVRPPDREFLTDSEGRFRVEGLVPGLKHAITLTSTAKKGFTLSGGKSLQNLSARAGEVKDLGDVEVMIIPVEKKGKK
jgi:RNA polymerase sigma factor (sigma-70 family)